MQSSKTTRRAASGNIKGRRRSVAISLILMSAVAMTGCDRQDPASSATQPATALTSQPELATAPETTPRVLPPYPGGLNAKSKPAEVGEGFLKALADNDEATLRGLVAYRSAVAALRGVIRTQAVTANEPTIQEAGDFTLDTWRYKFATFFVKGTAKIAKVEDGDQHARVWMEGENPKTGRPLTMIAHIVFEDYRWRVGPMLEILESPPPQ